MRNITVEELQKSLQSLANQKGAHGFEKAKALFLEGVVIVDEAGNPLDPSAINYEVTISPAVEVEEDAMSEEKPEEAAKSVASEVRAAVREEIAKSASKPAKLVKVESPKVHGRLRAFKSVDEAYRFGRWAMGCMGHAKSAQW